MAITIETKATTVIVHISGRLDAMTSQELEQKIKSTQRFISEMIFDFRELDYISSMGLRVILQAHKLMKERHGKLIFKNISDSVHNIFEMSGFIQTIVRDEKAAIIKKPNQNAAISYLLAGGMDQRKAAELKTDWEMIKKEGVTGISLECSELTTISRDAGQILSDMQREIKKNNGVFSMQNMSDEIKAELKAAGLAGLMEDAPPAAAFVLQAEKTEAQLKATPSTKIFFSFKTWAPKEIPLLNKDWLNQHQGIKNVVLNFKDVGTMPQDALNILKKLKLDMAQNGVEIELELP